MSIWETMGFKSKEKKAQEAEEAKEQELGNQTEAKKRQITMLEGRIKEVQENVRMFGSAPADHSLIRGLEEQIATLRKEVAELEKPKLEIVARGSARLKLEQEQQEQSERPKLERVK